MKRTLPLGIASLVLAGASLLGQVPPAYQVDPLWPKPLPNHWLLGSVTGVAVDAQDHIWVVHRGYDSMTRAPRSAPRRRRRPPTTCCVPAPPVLEFDAAGNLVGHWGGPGDKYEWPVSPGGIAVDAKGAVWITAAGPPEIPGSANALAAPGAGGAGAGAARRRPGRGTGSGAPPKPQDAHVLKFSRTGEFLLQIGKAGEAGDNDSTTGLNRPAGLSVDAAGNEVYVADGFGNRRVAVFDATTGAYKRHWGAPATSRSRRSAASKSRRTAGLRLRSRQQPRPGVRQDRQARSRKAWSRATTKGTGSVWDMAFSNDAQQRFLFVADGHDQKIFILRRDTLAVVGSFGDGGRYPGTFYSVGSVAVDSKGNVYTGENSRGQARAEIHPEKRGTLNDKCQMANAKASPRRLDRSPLPLLALGLIERSLEQRAAAQAKTAVMAPRFEVDPLWPKPLPNHWVLGQAIGLSVDPQDHVWIVHRDNLLGANEAAASENPPVASCCVKAPPVLEFDPAGHGRRPLGRAAAKAMTGRSRITASRSITRATSGSAATSGPTRTLLKFTRAASSSMQFGKPGQNKGSNDTENFGRPAKIFIDAKANEAYIADGYGNKRVVVIDADTGKFKRYWGAYGNKPDDTNFGAYDPDGAADQAVPHAGALRRALQRRPRLRVRPAERSHPGLQAGRQVRQGGLRRDQHARRRLGVGHRVLEGSAAEVPVPRRRQEREDLRHAARDDGDPHDASATAAGSPGSSSPCTASRSTRRATSTPPRPTRAGACRSSSTRDSHR